MGGSSENSHPLWLRLISQACGQKWAAEPVKLAALVCCKHKTGSWVRTQWPRPSPWGPAYRKLNLQMKQFVAYPGQLIRVDLLHTAQQQSSPDISTLAFFKASPQWGVVTDYIFKMMIKIHRKCRLYTNTWLIRCHLLVTSLHVRNTKAFAYNCFFVLLKKCSIDCRILSFFVKHY